VDNQEIEKRIAEQQLGWERQIEMFTYAKRRVVQFLQRIIEVSEKNPIFAMGAAEPRSMLEEALLLLLPFEISAIANLEMYSNLLDQARFKNSPDEVAEAIRGHEDIYARMAEADDCCDDGDSLVEHMSGVKEKLLEAGTMDSNFLRAYILEEAQYILEERSEILMRLFEHLESVEGSLVKLIENAAKIKLPFFAIDQAGAGEGDYHFLSLNIEEGE